MRQDVKTATKKQPPSQPGVKSAVDAKRPGLLNLEQILIGAGILTQTSDRQAIAKALGLSERRPYDFRSN